MQPSADICRLIEIMAALRTPQTGCPWDLQQTHQSLAPYALEEAYEVVDAIERGDMLDLRDELGDLLLQVVFHARVAEEAGAFAFGDVVEGVTAKMVRRHPHVFAETRRKPGFSGVDKIWEAMRAKREGELPQEDKGKVHGLLAAMPRAGDGRPALSNEVWEAIKAEERQAKAGGTEPSKGLLDGVTVALPGLTRAVKLQAKASTVGFDWGDAKLVLAKIREEIDEIEETLVGGTIEQTAGEIGDLVFAVANLARHAKVDPEQALRGTNAKFERRFAYIEKKLGERQASPATSTLAEMDTLWDEAKAAGL
jgi:ATP diphosphatase